MYRRLGLILFLVIPFAAQAQDFSSDTVHLHDVVVYGLPLKKFSAGYMIISFDSSGLETFSHLSVGEYLSRKTPIFFRTYGNGMTSTISFRGTGPSHTAVLWNGLEINQPTLGQTDFSLLPVLATDRIDVQYGSASSLYGSDAIGGSILLSTLPDWSRGIGVQLSQDFSDYGQSFSSLGVRAGSGTAGLKTRLYFDDNPNRFTFRNITRQGSPNEKQRNAAVTQQGIIQDIYFKAGKDQQVKVSAWYDHNYRELQPVMSDNVSHDKLEQKDLRISGDYILSRPGISTDLKFGYLGDCYLFDGNDKTLSGQWIVQGEASKKIGKVTFHAGGKYDYLTATADTYLKKIYEERIDLFSGVEWEVTPRLNVSVNARQQLVQHIYSPFAPSLGSDLLLVRKPGAELHWNMQFSRSYRIPTFNDRFWQPGGNPDLKPENGKTAETGIAADCMVQGFRMGGSLQLYWMKVNNWIVWIPGAEFWSPENVKKVQGTGIEINYHLKKTYGEMATALTLSYSLSNTIDKSNPVNSAGEYDKQLAYTPKNNGRASFSLNYRTWYAGLDYEYTGLRYLTSDDTNNLPVFNLVDLKFGKSMNVFGGNLSGYLRIRNLTNTSYQVMTQRAMPGTNFGISLNYNFNR